MLFVVKIVMQVQKTFFIRIAVGLNISQNFDLIKWLIKVLFVVLNDFKTVSLLIGEIFDLNCIWELSLAQIWNDLISSRQNLVDHNLDVSLLFESCLISIIYDFEIITVVNDLIHLHGIRCRINLFLISLWKWSFDVFNFLLFYYCSFWNEFHMWR